MMTKPDAEIILSIPDIHWGALCRYLEEFRNVASEKLENPTKHHDEDMMHKGSIALCRDLLNLKVIANAVLSEKKEE